MRAKEAASSESSRRPPAVRGRSRKGIHEEHETSGNRERSREIEVPMLEFRPALAQKPGVSAIAASPTGTLMKKIQGQPRAEVSRPPSKDAGCSTAT